MIAGGGATTSSCKIFSPVPSYRIDLIGDIRKEDQKISGWIMTRCEYKKDDQAFLLHLPVVRGRRRWLWQSKYARF